VRPPPQLPRAMLVDKLLETLLELHYDIKLKTNQNTREMKSL